MLQLGRNPIGANGAFALLSAIGKNENSTLNLLDLTVSMTYSLTLLCMFFCHILVSSSTFIFQYVNHCSLKVSDAGTSYIIGTKTLLQAEQGY